MFDTLSLPVLGAPQAEVHTMRSMALERAVQAATQSQSLLNGMHDGLCMGGERYYAADD